MRVEFVDPFVKAAYSVLSQVLADEPKRGALAIRSNTFTSQQVTIMAGVNGDVEGAALYGMSLATAQKIASAMMGEEEVQMDDMAWSAISELGNMITGNATRLLYDAGFESDITPPTVLRGTNIEISTKSPALVVPVSTKYGWVEINVAITESYKVAKAA
jgi:chemotaxis protein CheX